MEYRFQLLIFNCLFFAPYIMYFFAKFGNTLVKAAYFFFQFTFFPKQTRMSNHPISFIGL